MEILSVLMLGGALKEIAANQFVSRNTVKSHVRTSHQKLHVSTRTEATEIMRRLVQQRGESPVFDERKHPERERQKICVPQAYFYANLGDRDRSQLYSRAIEFQPKSLQPTSEALSP